MTRRKMKEYEGYQVMDDSKYDRFYAMYDLFMIRELEPYSKLRKVQRIIIDEDIINFVETTQPVKIPERIKKTYRVVVGMDKVRKILAKALVQKNKIKL